jgi:diguanylate cyclase (GGDEF)-like protein
VPPPPRSASPAPPIVRPVARFALALSVCALLAPLAAALLVPDTGSDPELLLWLLVPVPAFLLAYHRGWRGVALALAVGTAALATGQAASLALGRTIGSGQLLLVVVGLFVVVSLAFGWLSELVRALVRAEELALTDDLTGIANRRHARTLLEKQFSAAERGRDLAVVLFDIDLFKEYNDLHGHSVGDEALVAFADLLRRETRRMDLCSRYGGEEFLCVLTATGLDGVLGFVDRIRDGLATTTRVPPLTVSAGVALFRHGMLTPEELIAAADGALYGAKHLGRNEVRVAGGTPAPLSAGPPADAPRVSVPVPADEPAPVSDGGETPHPRAGEAAPRYGEVLPLHDPVTGVYNRTGLIRRLERSLHRARRQDAADFSVLHLDLDQFRIVNDGLGFAVGDQLLAAVARRIEHCVRPEDMIARPSADEFVILLFKNERPADSARVAERLLASFAKSFQIESTPLFATASIGIVASPGYASAEELLRDAQLAMVLAKESGRSSFRFFQPELHERAVARLHLENDLRRGLESSEFSVDFQPVVSLLDDRIVGVEALARWHHPTRGCLPPSEFIPIAEEMGLIVRLGYGTLAHAMEALAAWSDALDPVTDFFVSVNLTGREFTDPDLEAVIERLLLRTGADPRRLRLELTEGVLVRDLDATAERLRRLGALGITAQVDDFGTGYSSLNYLHRLPVNAMKIDRTFIASLVEGSREMALLEHVVQLAHTLELEVVAEGIETPQQRSLLAGLGCDHGQGFYFSRPVSADTVTEILRCGRALPDVAPPAGFAAEAAAS